MQNKAVNLNATSYMLPSQDKLDIIVKHTSNTIDLMLGSILDIADSYMRDAVEMLKLNSLFRFSVKREANLAFAAYDKIKKITMPDTTQRTQLYLDVLDIISDNIAADVKKLYYPIKQVIDSHHVNGADYKALIELVWSLLYVAQACYKGIIDATRAAVGVSLEHFFSEVNPLPVFLHWDNITQDICRYSPDMKMAFQNNIHIKRATEILQKKLLSFDVINECCRDALRLNPETVNEYFERHPDAQLEL